MSEKTLNDIAKGLLRMDSETARIYVHRTPQGITSANGFQH